eukprot:8716753-Pyramimonas_sp.AAC.1
MGGATSRDPVQPIPQSWTKDGRRCPKRWAGGRSCHSRRACRSRPQCMKNTCSYRGRRPNRIINARNGSTM